MKNYKVNFVYLSLIVLSLLTINISCSDDEDPVNVSDQIGIKITLKEDDITGNTIDDRKNISTEQSNPYAQFITQINTELGNVEPSEIRVEGVVLNLESVKDDVATLEDLFTGTVEVFLASDDQTVGYTIGTIDNPEGTGPIEMNLATEPGDLVPFLDQLLSGTFRVGIRSETPRTNSDKFEAVLTVTITFAAYK